MSKEQQRMANLQALETGIRHVQRQLIFALLDTWPEGSRINVRLNRNQLNPSAATVLSASGDGRLTVKLDTRGRRGYQTVKHVHWTNVS